MSDKSTIQLIDMYAEQAVAPMYFASMFQSPPRNYHNTEAVEIDVIRESEDVAIVITDLATGSHVIETDIYTSKRLTPPIYSEKGAVNAFKLMQRQAGQSPFDNPNYLRSATLQTYSTFGKGERKIRRAIELMASQVLQTGALTLIGADGNARYSLNFVPKTGNFPTTSISWPVVPSANMDVNVTSTAYADLSAWLEVIRQNGKKRVTRLTFGGAAFDAFLLDPKVKNRLIPVAYGASAIGNGTGRLAPADLPEDAVFQGWVRIGNYEVEMVTYPGWYKHPQTGTLTQYMDTNKVVATCKEGRLDLTFGNIPRIVPPDPRALPFLPERIALPGVGMDIITNAWITDDGFNLMVSASARPLTIPTAIDTIGCLTAIH